MRASSTGKTEGVRAREGSLARLATTWLAGVVLAIGAAAQGSPTDEDRQLVEAVFEALRASDRSTLEELYDPATRLADVDGIGLAERAWSDLDEVGRRGHLLNTVAAWLRNESRYHAESTLVEIVTLDDPNAGLGLLDRRSVLRARLRNLRDDAVRDLIVVAADGRLLALEFGEIGDEEPLEPEAWPRREPRSPNWPDDVDLYERDALAELVDEFEIADDPREEAELVEELHRDPHVSIAALLERLIELDRLDPSPSDTKTKHFAAISRITGRRPPGGVESGDHDELVAWLRWQQAHGRDFKPAPIVDPLAPTASERLAGAEGSDAGEDYDGWADALAKRRERTAAAATAPADEPAAKPRAPEPESGAPAPWQPPERKVVGLDTPAPSVDRPARDVLSDDAAALELRRAGKTYRAAELVQQLSAAQRIVLNDWAELAVAEELVIVVPEDADAIVFAATAEKVADQAAEILDRADAIVDPLVPVVDGRDPGATAAFLIDYERHRDEVQLRVVEAFVEARVLDPGSLDAMAQDPTSLMVRGLPGFLQFTWDMAGNAAAGDDEFRVENEVANKYAQCVLTTRTGPNPEMLRWGFGFVVENELFNSVYMFNTTGFVSVGDHFDWHTRTRQYLEKRRSSWNFSDDLMSDVEVGEAKPSQMITWGCLEYLRGKDPEGLRALFGRLGDAQREASKWSTLFRVPDAEAAAIVDEAFEGVEKKNVLAYLKATR